MENRPLHIVFTVRKRAALRTEKDVQRPVLHACVKKKYIFYYKSAINVRATVTRGDFVSSFEL